MYVYSADGTLSEKQTANGEKTCYQIRADSLSGTLRVSFLMCMSMLLD